MPKAQRRSPERKKGICLDVKRAGKDFFLLLPISFTHLNKKRFDNWFFSSKCLISLFLFMI
jgi:hypothetical protein